MRYRSPSVWEYVRAARCGVKAIRGVVVDKLSARPLIGGRWDLCGMRIVNRAARFYTTTPQVEKVKKFHLDYWNTSLEPNLSAKMSIDMLWKTQNVHKKSDSPVDVGFFNFFITSKTSSMGYCFKYNKKTQIQLLRWNQITLILVLKRNCDQSCLEDMESRQMSFLGFISVVMSVLIYRVTGPTDLPQTYYLLTRYLLTCFEILRSNF